jgi:glycosyltransferase involved in cell wall biosynthesis
MKISVVIPAYNRAQSICPAINSVLDQSLKCHEIIIVDDGSQDDLAQVLKPYGNAITLIRHKTNLGASAARNTGIKAATGDTIAFLDSDDVWLPEKLRKQSEFMQNLDLQASCTNFYVSSRPPGKVTPLTSIAHRPYGQLLTVQDCVWGCFISPGSTFMCKTALLKKVGGYDTKFPRYEDWDLLLKLIDLIPEKFGFLNEATAKIFPSGNPGRTKALAGLSRMQAQHMSRLTELGLKNKFEAAILFNQASQNKLDRKYVEMFSQIIKCALLVPRNNWPLKNILAYRLKNFLSAFRTPPAQ